VIDRVSSLERLTTSQQTDIDSLKLQVAILSKPTKVNAIAKEQQ